MIRTFIAVAIPDSVRDSLGRLQSALKTHGGNVKWVRPESIHITLKFLGEVPQSRIESISQAVREAVEGTSPFFVTISGTGTFPDDRRPRVLWVGVSQGKESLVQLANRSDQALAGIGFKRETRPYSPHLTLGRIRSTKGIQTTVDAIHQTGFDGGSFEVNDVFVMRSELKPTGAVYSVIEAIKLQG